MNRIVYSGVSVAPMVKQNIRACTRGDHGVEISLHPEDGFVYSTTILRETAQYNGATSRMCHLA